MFFSGVPFSVLLLEKKDRKASRVSASVYKIVIRADEGSYNPGLVEGQVTLELFYLMCLLP